MSKSSDNIRSNEPIFWGLFGAGGMWSALFSPAVILIVCFLLPLSVIDPINAYDQLLGFSESFLGRIFIFLTIALPVWSGVHRIHHCMHDFKIHCLAMKWLCYVFAALVSVVTLFLVVTL